MLFETKISMRFLINGKSQTLFILMGIAFGIAVQIFLSAIITGVQKDLIDKTIGASAHIVVKASNFVASQNEDDKDLKRILVSRSKQEEKNIMDWSKITTSLNSMPEINTAAPIAEGSGFVSIGERNIPILVRGVNTELSEKIYRFSKRLLQGTSIIDSNKILIGIELAKDLNVGIGETIRIITAQGVSDIFIVSGIFDFGNQVTNKSWVFMSLPRTQKFLGYYANVSSIEIQLKNPFNSEKIAPVLRSLFKNVEFETWQQTNQQLLTALKSQSSSSNIIQFFIILAVALGISSVLAVSVMQKSRQIGILKAMGTTDRSIGLIFIFQGFILGFLGGLVGCATGATLVQLFILLTSSGKGPTFSIAIDSSMLIFSVFVSIGSSVIAAFLPSIRSMKLNPIEVIKNG